MGYFGGVVRIFWAQPIAPLRAAHLPDRLHQEFVLSGIHSAKVGEVVHVVAYVFSPDPHGEMPDH